MTRTEISVSVLNELKGTEEADVDFLLKRLAELSVVGQRALIKSFRHQVIYVAAESAQDYVTQPAPTEKELWHNGCLTRFQVEKWTDRDLAYHSEGVRKTLKFLLGKLDAKDKETA